MSETHRAVLISGVALLIVYGLSFGPVAASFGYGPFHETLPAAVHWVYLPMLWGYWFPGLGEALNAYVGFWAALIF